MPANDTVESRERQAALPAAPWLILIHQLPPEPAYLRVKVRRRLQAIGALPLKNSVYVLPASGEALEDFDWLCRMIEDEKAWATVVSAGFVQGTSDAEMRALFNQERDASYERIAKVARRAARSRVSEAEAARIRRDLERTIAVDFFGASGRPAAERAVADLFSPAAADREASARAARPPAAPLRGKTWVTRAGVYVDRLSCAWLIRRFVDAEARFKFVSGRAYPPAEGEIRFDMYDGEFTHRGEDCTFEVMAAHFAPDDPRLETIGEIVHDLDFKEDRFGRPETPGVRVAIDGVVAAETSDEARIERGTALFDALYAGLGGEPRGR